MSTESYSLAEILAVAKTHPFYNADVTYPGTAAEIQEIRHSVVDKEVQPDLREQPLLEKKTLYKAISRLTHDVDPQNAYRHGCYMSITGGGSGGVPMLFAVDAFENRRQRAQVGKFLSITGVIEPKDWVLSTHLAGGFYRSLDLMVELFEMAGATVLSAGSYMPPAQVASSLADYHVNALTGDSSQIIQVVHAISMMKQEDRSRICLNKIIYTSEPLTDPQRSFIKTVLGNVKILSVLGSSEAGAWAVSNPELTGEQPETLSGSNEFVFDIRHVFVEILPLSTLEDEHLSGSTVLPYGEKGLIVQTSLQRLRNPLVRYITGDVGSLYPLPESAYSKVPEADRKYLRVLRMQGRDRRFSFKWYACYFEFDTIEAFMQTPDCGILQWQVILDKLDGTPEATLEIRLLRSSPRDGIIPDDELLRRLAHFFSFFPENEHLSKITILENIQGFERSATAGKVIKFVDRWH
ncbi:hypothetical protein N7478_008312 [Penicillium angulare]|uniref:uncharacterized protein n=1 Tax=Penicillium angulare TaxID=116970 RepID=UPI00253FCF65|nr:uncharacterized protein N7478_008312 [Penicillium angulare]KAJ5273187.1 hypothetical protein N7478_008312 [Penicillium angulare]